MNSDLSESYSDIKSSASSPMLHTKFLRFMRRLKVCTPVKRVWRRFSRFWRRICWTETMLRINDRTETQVSQWTFKERPVFSEAQTSKRPHYKWKVRTAQHMNNWCLSKSERLNLNLMDFLSDRRYCGTFSSWILSSIEREADSCVLNRLIVLVRSGSNVFPASSRTTKSRPRILCDNIDVNTRTLEMLWFARTVHIKITIL